METLHKKISSNLWVFILALLAFPFALSIGTSGYDAPIHMFFGDHYVRSWFDLWDPRWYNGFTVASYPPLAHQLLAILELTSGKPTLSYALLSSISIALYAYALARYSNLFLGRRVSILGSIASILAPATMISFLIYGHLTTILSTALTFLSFTMFIEYAKRRRRLNLLASSLLASASIYSHHFTALVFSPILFITTISHLWLNDKMRSSRFLVQILQFLSLTATFSLGIYPFVEFALNAPTQAEIPHWSRYPLNPDYLQFSICYSLITYGLIAASILRLVLRGRELKPLASLIATTILLAALSLGLSTPLPQLLFQGLSKWLTYERFSFWATPLSVILLLRSITSNPRKISTQLAVILLIILFIGLATVSAIVYLKLGAWMRGYVPTYTSQSSLNRTCIRAIAQFLHENCREGCRYLTLGFSTKASEISILSNARTIDGFYPTARRDPLLTQSGVESLDSAIYWSNGLEVLDRVLSKADSYGLKYVIVREHYEEYSEILEAHGYRPDRQICDASIWINSHVDPIESKSSGGGLSIGSLLWGVMPLATLSIGMSLMIADELKES